MPAAAPASRPDATLRFADFEIRPRERLLLKDGERRRLGSRAFDLLLALVERRDRFVSADELRRTVWPDRVVEDNNLRVHLTALRKALGAEAIVHHARQGYRLVADLLADEGGASDDREEPLPGNLPPPLAAVYGRDAEIATLGLALAMHDRVTLVGTAGVGKTTLALAVAHGILERGSREPRFADGVWLVELAALTAGAMVPGAVAQALGLKLAHDGPAQTPVTALAKALARHRALLVLDNGEHLIGAVSTLCDALLRGAPGVVVLATSRKVLRAAGEHAIAVGPLALPAGPDAGLATARTCGALALFESRARVVDPRFALTKDNVAPAIEICEGLDGIALAIVLAASRVPLLGIVGVRDRLRAGLLPLAARGAVDGADRHRTLVAALAWSHALLSADEQAVYRRLGAFVGGFALDDVEHVCADDALDADRVVQCIDGLIEHSLVATDVSALHGIASPRFAMHEMVRVHARDQLDGHAEASAVRRRHAARFARIAEGDAGPGTMNRPDRVQSLPMADHDNLRAALDWAIEHEAVLALALATATSGFWRLRGHHVEALRWSDAILARAASEEGRHPGAAADALALGRARLMFAMCGVAFEVHRIDVVERFAADAEALFEAHGDAHGMSHAVMWSAIALYVRRDLDRALPLYLEARERFRACGDRDGEATALANLASLATELGRYDDAIAWLQGALALHRAMGSAWGVALDRENLGEVAFARGELVDAHAHWIDALAGYRAIGHEFRVASMLQHLAAVLVRLERPAQARDGLVESLALCRRCGFEALAADGLGGLAAIAAVAGDGRTAAILLRVAERQRERLGCRVGGIALRTTDDATRTARSLLDEAQWRDACVDADALTAEQAVGLFASARAVQASITR